MLRSRPYLNQPTSSYITSLEIVSQKRFYLLNRPGPTVFVVKERSALDDVTFKVILGSILQCSCHTRSYRVRKDREGLHCEHLVFVIVKVLKLPQTNPLSWQESITDAEITSILSGSHFTESHRRFKRDKQKSVDGTDETSSDDALHCKDRATITERKAIIDGDNHCPICQETISKVQLEEGELCFCQNRCGTNFHIKCMKILQNYNMKQNKPLQCPLCRSIFDLEKGKEKMNTENENRKTSLSRRKNYFIKCSACGSKISGESHFFRCIICKEHDCCSICFRRTIGICSENDHIFLEATCSEYPKWNWTPPAKRFLKRHYSRPNQLLEVEHRELTVNDYDLLISLDDTNESYIFTHLLGAFPESCNLRDQTCCFCGRPVSNGIIRRMPCGKHFSHDVCLLSILMDNHYHDKLYEMNCIECSVEYFPSLKRKPYLIEKQAPNIDMKKAQISLSKETQFSQDNTVSIIGKKITGSYITNIKCIHNHILPDLRRRDKSRRQKNSYKNIRKSDPYQSINLDHSLASCIQSRMYIHSKSRKPPSNQTVSNKK